jgi:hypothetical protein
MTNLNYGVSVTPGTISELPWYIANWHINFADLVVADQGNHASELNYIKSLKLEAHLDIEMVIWAGGQIQDAIQDYAGYLQGLKAAGWQYVCSEGGRSGDPSFMKSKGLDYINYNCDQCGLWKDIYTDPGTALNLWEAYYPNEVQYITQGAGSGKPNGVLAGAWANNGGDNGILTNSINGGQPSYKSIIDSLIAQGKKVTYFEVWGGENSSHGENSALGFDGVVANLQKYYPPNGTTPGPGPAPPGPTPPAHIIVSSSPAVAGGYIFVKGSDSALWWRTLTGQWAKIGGVLTSAPCAIERTADTSAVDVYARGNDGGLWHLPIMAGKLGVWSELTGKILVGTDPVASTNGDLYVVGTDHAVWRLSGGKWTSLGSILK